MKILHISSATTWRGGENQICLLTRGLQTLGVENAVLCPAISPLIDPMSEQSQPLFLYEKKAGIDMHVSRMMVSAVDKHNYDIIHAHDTHALNYVIFAKLLKCQAKVVVTRRVDFDPSFLGKYKYKSRMIDHIVCVSDAVKKVMIQSGVDANKCSTIYSGIESNNNSKNEIQLSNFVSIANRKVIAFVGALVDHKDPMTFVKAAHRHSALSNHDCAYVMIGHEGEQLNQVIKYIRNNKLSGKVYYIGFIEQLVTLWNQIDMLVVTSKLEGLGSTILEAFAHEVPVIATLAGGIKEIVHHNKTGLLCEIGHVDQVAKSIEELLNEEARKEKLIQSAKKYSEKFHYIKTSALYKDLYDFLI